ncbi:hypothetical protein BC830DRAFT_34969 [Chytriomyces sp. MP71]|nr:hypothetical protein BC830DRAFT_34969 [Chytriomyces sp. MP71]
MLDIESALQKNASNLEDNKEWTQKPAKDVSYSLVLRVLRNHGFLHIRMQANINLICTLLTKLEQVQYLAWIKANTHCSFQTGAELILLNKSNLNMISCDHSDSTKNIDQIGQTIVADTWAFNRLSNSLSEAVTKQLLARLLAGVYVLGDVAFVRRNGAGIKVNALGGLEELSPVWEQSIVLKWFMMLEAKQN